MALVFNRMDDFVKKNYGIFKYECPYNPFTLSCNPCVLSKDLCDNPCGDCAVVAVGSFLLRKRNRIEILHVRLSNQEDWRAGDIDCSIKEKIKYVSQADHDFSISKLKWSPSNLNQNILASSGPDIKLWKVDSGNKLSHMSILKSKSKHSAPVTSIDWSSVDHNILGSSSVDTTCTVWDVETSKAKVQLIAHDSQVYDLSFSNNSNVFASTGKDGSVRIFDTRNLEHSTILYETPDNSPLLRLSWNKLDEHFIITFNDKENSILLLDTRFSSIPIARLVGHNNIINDIFWAPHSSPHLVSTSDDNQIIIWNLLKSYDSEGVHIKDNDHNVQEVFPNIFYQLSSETNQIVWSDVSPNSILFTDSQSINVIHI